MRWLLKSMNGSSPAADLIRRYPLTWTILDCVFQRIPLFSLAKSLADRKFISVLQQTLKGLSKPGATSCSSASPKRKRTPAVGFDLGLLQAQAGCLETARVVFKALNSLLCRLESLESASTRENIGAQHIRSLFCNPAAEAISIVAPALSVCSMLVSNPGGSAEGEESWIDTISSIWDLHLQRADDGLEVATHLFRPSATIIARIGGFPSGHELELPEALKTRWNASLETFIHRNLIVPGRAAFINNRVFEVFARVLEMSKSMAHLAAPALYHLSSTVSKWATEAEPRKDSVAWLKRIFEAIEQTIRNRPDRGKLMQTILKLAVQQSTPVDVEDLRRVCREYALQSAETDWVVVERVAACDPDVFQLSEDGANLRREICDLISKQEPEETTHEPMSKVIGAIMEGFRTRRALTSFLRLWYEQLCTAERHKSRHCSPWFNVGRLAGPTQSLGHLLENELSPSQLLEIFTWIQTQNPTAHPHSTCVFSAFIAQALRSESFVDAVGSRLFDLVAPLDSSAEHTALRWRVVSSTMSWTAPDERVRLWNLVKGQVAEILETAPVVSDTTFQTFKCCLGAWDSLSLDDTHRDEAAALIGSFSERLASEMADNHVLDGNGPSFMEFDSMEELREDSAAHQYLAWYLRGSSRFCRLYYARNGALPGVLLNALSNQKGSVDGLNALWCALLRNEVNLNETRMIRDLIDRLIASIENAKDKKGWPGERSLFCIKILSRIPLEAFDRAQRERLMTVISKRRRKTIPEKVSLSSWRAVLSLTTKMMGRPTFYEGMRFSDLVEVAEAMSGICIESQTGSEAVAVELIERVSLMASATIRQMAENIDERSITYFQGASKFISDSLTRTAVTKAAAITPGHPLYMTLLKALVSELTRAPSWQSQEKVVSLCTDTTAVLGSFIMDVMSRFMSEKKNSDSPMVNEMSLFAAVDAAEQAGDLARQSGFTSSGVRKLEKRSSRLMRRGDIRGWKLQAFLRSYLTTAMEMPRPTTYEGLEGFPEKLGQPLLRELVTATTKTIGHGERCQYLRELLDGLRDGFETNGQVLAIRTVVNQLLGTFAVMLCHVVMTEATQILPRLRNETKGSTWLRRIAS